MRWVRSSDPRSVTSSLVIMLVATPKDAMTSNDKFAILEGIPGFAHVLDFFAMHSVVSSTGLRHALESGRWERLFLL